MTCATVVPDPAAMRCRRLPLMRSGFRRSFMVMELMTASVRAISCSGAFRSPSLEVRPPSPGISLRMFSSDPIFFMRRIWVRKSSKSNVAFCSFLAMASASSASKELCAFSMSVSISPMPRIRPATRSGWNTSRSESFSPTPTYLTEAPVTDLMDRAAPPRASPSILVRTTPVRARSLLKASATVTAS